MPGSLDKECKVTQNLSGKLLELLRAGNWQVGLSASSCRLRSLLDSRPGLRQPSKRADAPDLHLSIKKVHGMSLRNCMVAEKH